jgi:hypothetical protein
MGTALRMRITLEEASRMFLLTNPRPEKIFLLGFILRE